MKPITALLILDGFGCRESEEFNAISTDGIENIRALWESYPHTMGFPRGRWATPRWDT